MRHEFFTYVHYPIRFNRKTRKVYIFRKKGKNGTLIVPWDKVFFHVGHGMQQTNLCDIRGEVLDGDTVVDTFVLGHFFERRQPVLEMWEFIRRYMDEGPEAVADDPLDKYVSLSVRPTFKNCFLFAGNYYGASNGVQRVLSLPFNALSTVIRWLIFKTCREPAFPPEVEAECQVAPNDPSVWPIPDSFGQFAAENPAIMRRAVEKARGQTGPSALSDSFKNWQPPTE